VTASRRLVLTSALVAAEILIACAPAASRTEVPYLAPEVRAAVSAGRTRILVELRIAGAVGPTTDAIAAVQEEVLARLADTDHRVARRYASIPWLALEVGAVALGRIERMGDLVARVLPDVRVPASDRSPGASEAQ
jgi:hypothetical protein